MYSTKTINKHINPNYPQVYISIGDPYKSSSEGLPQRWKGKQFCAPHQPANAQNGHFTKLEYSSELYAEHAEPNLDNRKLGFGSKEYKSGEFLSSRSTERYRELLQREKRKFDRFRDTSKEKDLISKWESKERLPPKNKHGQELSEPEYLYDIGRSHVTDYNPNETRDSFYVMPKHAPVDAKKKGEDSTRRLGFHRPMSMEIGEAAWTIKHGKPEYGQVHKVNKFYDRGHLECKGS